jgi:nucleoside-diphosphate-sugar epimerase
VTSRRPTEAPVIVVTGAHGAIGSWCVRALRAHGARVIAFDLAAHPVVRLEGGAADATVVGDLRDAHVLEQLIQTHRPAAILHLAAIVGEACDRDPALAIEVNALATARLIAVARAAGVGRIVAMSTKGVLGDLAPRHLHPHYEPVPTEAPIGPRTMYETTKLMVERLVEADRARGGDATAIRLATTWGPGKTGATHGGFSLHSEVVAAAAAGRSSALDVHPDQGHDLVYYADVGEGLAACVLADGRLAAPVYHLGSGRITRAADFAAAVEAIFPGVRVSLGQVFPGGRNCLLDIGRAREDFGYEPVWDVTAAVRDMKRRLADESAPVGSVPSTPRPAS